MFVNKKISKKNTRINYIANLASQFLAIITPLITTPYVARVLQADGVGLYSYTASTAAIFVTIAQLGTSTYGSREIAYCRNDKERRTNVFYNVFLLRWLVIAVSFCVYLAIFCRHTEVSENYRPMFILQSLTIIATGFDVSWLYAGMEDFSTVALRDLLSKILSVLSIFIFIKSKDQIYLYTLLLAIDVILARGLSWFPLRKYIGKPNLKEINIFENISVILLLFIPQISGTISGLVDKFMIGMMTSTTYANGYYVEAEKIVSLCLALSTSIVGVMFPKASALFAQHKVVDILRITKKTSRFLWMLCLPAGLGMISIIDKVVPWFLGSGFEEVIPLTRLLSARFLIAGISSGIGSLLLLAKGRQKEYVICVMFGTISNIILNVILIPKMYAIGAAIATVITSAFSCILQYYYVRKEYKITESIKEARPYIVPALLMFGIVYFCKGFFPPTIGSTFVLISIGIVVYAVMLLIKREELFMENIKIVYEKIKKVIFRKKY